MPVLSGTRPYIIAEIGANHNGDMDLARQMVRTAKEIGCHCVKFQSFDERLFAKEIYDKAAFLDDGRDVKNDLLTAVRAYSLSPEDLRGLRDYCREIGIHFASSAFEPDQAQVLADLKADFIKVASMDVNNDPLLTAIGRTGLPVVLSSGMATLGEMAHAVDVLEATGNRDIVLMHCVSLYPPPDEATNLNNIDLLADTFGYPVGFSDHSEGTVIPLAAVAKGAVMIEKHFTLDKAMEGWDHAISADPAEMGELTAAAERIHAALGQRRRSLSEAEIDKRKVMRRSVVSARAIKAGSVITAEDITFRRPGSGLAPEFGKVLVGMVAARDIDADTLLRLEDVKGAH